MSEKQFDITFSTQQEYVNPQNPDWYVEQIILEDKLLYDELNKMGYRVHITHWDNPSFDWSTTTIALIRAVWDYSGRIQEFYKWLSEVSTKCHLLNPYETIKWNLDKSYLLDLAKKGVAIPDTYIVKQGDERSLETMCNALNWESIVLKPTVSAGGRHTYLIEASNRFNYESLFSELIKKESMIIQLYQSQIKTKGEITLVCFGGQYSHAIRKYAKDGEFRVQDDFGGRVEEYDPSSEEIKLAERVMNFVNPIPAYGRVDMIWNNANELCISELELIEPELWLRFEPLAAKAMAQALKKSFFSYSN